MLNRRKFISKTSAGILATLLFPGMWKCTYSKSKRVSFKFRRYRPDNTIGKVTIVTPEDGIYMHTYYDIVPWSPSGRYLAVTRLPFQDHDPVYGETADVCIVDLYEQTIQTVYTTKAWGYQLGANLNWGKTDRYLYTNDIIEGEGVCTRIDLETEEVFHYVGPMTHIAPNESHVIGFPLDKINASQRGYGMPEVPGKDVQNIPVGPALKTEGIWKTDLKTNIKSLIVSIYDFYEKVPNKDDFKDRAFYLFFSKYNRQGTRCNEFLRGVMPNPPKGQPQWMQMALNHKPDGSDINMAVTYGVYPPMEDWHRWRPDWKSGGHHIAWTPDGDHFTMNLVPDGKTMRFCYFKYDGSEFKVLSEKILGGGHPTMEKTGKYLVTDAYPTESMVSSNKEVPIRLIDLDTEKEKNICTVYTLGKEVGGTLRCDAHPCWDWNYQKVCFNGAPEGKRQVFIADLESVL